MADPSRLAEIWKRNAQANADRLLEEYTGRTDKAARAASDTAQAAYVRGVMDPTNQARRQRELKKVTENDLNAAMTEHGATNYSNTIGSDSTKGRWERNTTPYIQAGRQLSSTLPPKPGNDPVANWMARGAPIAKKFKEMRDKGT